MTKHMASARPHNVPVRLSQTGMEWVDETRREHDVTRSDVIREALAVAAQHPEELSTRLKTIAKGF